MGISGSPDLCQGQTSMPLYIFSIRVSIAH